MLGTSKGQPDATDLLLIREFPKCGIHEVEMIIIVLLVRILRNKKNGLLYSYHNVISI